MKISGVKESDGQARALLPSAERRKATWSTSFSATSVAYAIASAEKPVEALPPELAAVKLLFVPATVHMGFTAVLSTIAVGSLFDENQLRIPTRAEFTW